MAERGDPLEQLRAELEQLRLQNNELKARLDNNSASTSNVSSVRPQIAPFWLERPAGWFAHVEAQFTLCGITADETKYSYIVSQIDSRLSRELDDLVRYPPEKGKRYEWIKQEMIRRYSISDSQRIRQLVSGEELGDRKPSQFLRHLKSLAGNLAEDALLRELFMQRLPKSVQQILAAHADLSLDRIAGIADSILEVTGPSVSAVHDSQPDLQTQLQELSRKVDALTHSNDSRSRRSSRSRSRYSSRSRSRSSSESPGQCWYHRRFGVKATKCTKPCTWTAPENRQHSQ